MAKLTVQEVAKIILRDGSLQPKFPQADGIQDCIGIVAEIKRNCSDPRAVRYLRNEVQRMLCNLQVEDSESNIDTVIKFLKDKLIASVTPPAN